MHVRKLITQYLADDLSSGRAKRMRRHLQDCAACRAYYDEQVRLMRALHGDPESVTPEETERMVLRVSDDLGLRQGRAPRVKWVLSFASVSAVLCLLVLLVWKLVPGETPWLDVGSKSTAVVKTQLGTELRIYPNSRYRLNADESELELARGKVWCLVRPGQGGFVVRTVEARASVLGTSFVVDRRKEGRTEVRVMKGKVEVIGRKGRAVLVKAGQRTRVAVESAAERVKAYVAKRDRSEWLRFWRRLGRDLSRAAEDLGDLILGQ